MEPVNLTRALAAFDETYSPRIAATVNDYHVKIAHFQGDHLWHVHQDTDEFFLVLDGSTEIAFRDGDGTEHTVVLRKGDTFVVPKGVPHKPSAQDRAEVLMFEPAGTRSTGDRYEGEIPDHVESTTGHRIG